MSADVKIETVIGEVRKNPREIIRISYGTFQGKVGIDARVFYKHTDGTDGDGKPQLRGFMLRPGMVTSFIDLMQDAEDLMVAKEIIPAPEVDP